MAGTTKYDPVLSFADFEKKYSLTQSSNQPTIREGVYADMFIGFDTSTMTKIVLKRERQCQDENGIAVHILREVAILQDLCDNEDKVYNKHIVKFRQFEFVKSPFTDVCVYLVFDYVEMDLEEYLQRYREHASIFPGWYFNVERTIKVRVLSLRDTC